MYSEQTSEEKELLDDLTRVAEANPTLAALTIINLRAIIKKMNDHKKERAHADDIVEQMKNAYLG